MTTVAEPRRPRRKVPVDPRRTVLLLTKHPRLEATDTLAPKIKEAILWGA